MIDKNYILNADGLDTECLKHIHSLVQPLCVISLCVGALKVDKSLNEEQMSMVISIDNNLKKLVDTIRKQKV